MDMVEILKALNKDKLYQGFLSEKDYKYIEDNSIHLDPKSLTSSGAILVCHPVNGCADCPLDKRAEKAAKQRINPSLCNSVVAIASKLLGKERRPWEQSSDTVIDKLLDNNPQLKF